MDKGPQEPPMPPAPPMQEPPMMGGPADMPQDDGMVPEQPDGGEDPKKKIQQKAGKISNELSSYQGEDKIEVAKYVKGMIDKAADNIIDGDGGDDMPQGDMPQDQMPPMSESIVDEIVNDVISKRGKRDTGRGERKVTNTKVSKHNPFLAER